jgi:hypothetical protein
MIDKQGSKSEICRPGGRIGGKVTYRLLQVCDRLANAI